jgi:hypothetical protein
VNHSKMLYKSGHAKVTFIAIFGGWE